MLDYFALIHKYIDPTSVTYRLYVPHVAMVTQKALAAARRLGLSKPQMQFIEEAAMLHDMGIIKTQAPEIGCMGDLPYLCHLVEGRKILEAEGLPQHALVAERHAGAGISRQDIIDQQYPLPARDMLAVTIEEQIISWADLFYGKNANRLWVAKSVEKVRKNLVAFGPDKVETFAAWQKKFKG